MTIAVTADMLLRIAGKRAHQQATIVPAIAPLITSLAPQHGVTTARRMTYFLGQTCEESDGFATMREYASGSAYEGRADLGNTHPGDGACYAGRGLIETTGRGHYREFTAWVRKFYPDAPDFEADPDKMMEPLWGTLSAFWFWEAHGCNTFADAGDIKGLTRRVNGGQNGLADRILFTGRAQSVLAAVASPGTPPVLRRGESGPDVLAWQQALLAAGFPITCDSSFGPATESVTKAFQRAHNLTADGIVGPATRAAA